MQVTIEIDDGGKARNALPIRAIPYVTDWNESPDGIVHALAPPNELLAYQMDAQGKHEQIPPSQWGSWVDTFDSLTQKLKAEDKREGTKDGNLATWRIKAILELPDNVFIWLDEFKQWYSSTRLSNRTYITNTDSDTPEDEDLQCIEGKQDDALNLSPIFPPEIENKVWRYPETLATLDEKKRAKDAPQIEPDTTPDDADWCIKARVIADECFDLDTSMNCRDTLKSYSARVMDKMQERGIKGPRGIIDNAGTIMREALQGKKWWANKAK